MGPLFFVSFMTLLLASLGSSQNCKCGIHEDPFSGRSYVIDQHYKDDSVQELLRSTSAFSGKFFKEIGKTTSSNVISSPLSVWTILAMLAQGAKGYTANEMCKALQLPAYQWHTLAGYQTLIDSLSQNNGKVKVRVANRIFLPCDIWPKICFMENSTIAFRSPSMSVDFGRAKCGNEVINEWYRNEMNGLLNDHMKPGYFNADTSLVLVSVAHLRGAWAQPFARATIDFSNMYGIRKLPAMSATNTYNYGKLPQPFNASFVEIPYADPRYSMIVILPWSYYHDELVRLENNLDGISVKEILQSGRPTKVDIFMPKMKIQTEVDLKETLKGLKMSTIFNRPDLSGIQNCELRVSKVIHKVFMDVTEAGTNVPSMASGGFAAPWKPQFFNKPVTFRVDHPFVALFVARYNNNPFTIFAARFAGY